MLALSNFNALIILMEIKSEITLLEISQETDRMIEKITADNTEVIEDIIDEDVYENLDRIIFHSVASIDEEESKAEAAVVFESFDENNETTHKDITIYQHGQKKVNAGKEVVDYMVKYADEFGADKTRFEFCDAGEEIIKLYKDAGFTISEKEGRDLYLTLNDVAKVKTLYKKHPSYVFSIKKLEGIQLWQGITNCMFFGRTGLLKDLEDVPDGWFDEELSSCVMTNNMVDGLFLIHKMPSGVIMPVLIFASEPDSSKNVLYLLRCSIRAALTKYPPDTKILLRRHDNKVRALTDKLFPGKVGDRVIAGEKEN